MITLIDYGAGNIGSVKKAFEYLHIPCRCVGSPADIDDTGGWVLPGVGAFGAAVDQLHKSGFFPILRQRLLDNKPFLGICLGMQLLLEKSGESPDAEGLGVIPGINARFQMGKTPLIGWNSVASSPGSRLFADIPDQASFYFIHSYFVPANTEGCTGVSSYYVPFAAALEAGNVCGVQFHPEKSGTMGLKLLSNWARLVAGEVNS